MLFCAHNTACDFFFFHSARQLTLESPVETAMLLSLSGVHCIMLNQWHTTIQRNVQNLDIILESKYSKHSSTV